MSNVIAETIRTQIGHSALYMIGAKDFMGFKNGFGFKLGKNAKKVNFVKITLNGLDLYDAEYGYIRGYKYTVRSTENDLYCDMLHGSIERNTGLYTKL